MTEMKAKKKRIKWITGLLLFALITTGAVLIGRQIVRKRMYPVGYEELVTKYADQYEVPRELVYAVILAESSYRPDAVSKDGAQGLMQILPSTFDWLMTKIDNPPESTDPFDPDQNIRCGVFYLQYQYKKFGNWKTALAAYNAGEGTVKKWLNDSNYSDDQETLKAIPYPETRNYVNKILTAMEIYPELYPELFEE